MPAFAGLAQLATLLGLTSMSSIFAGLGSAAEALAAQQFALEITQKNIANTNTAGYTRQRAAFTPANPADPLDPSTGSIAPTVSVDSYRDRFTEYRIVEEAQSNGEFEASSRALQQVESLLNENNSQGLQSSLSGFFNSFSSLANSPEDTSLRQQVLSGANVLTSEFHLLYDRIQTIQAAQDRAVADAVKDINSVTQQLAKLNTAVAAARTSNNGDESTLLDQRQQLLEKLSGLIDISYFETETGGLTVTTRQGIALVVADQNNTLQAGPAASGSLLRIQVEGQDITASIQSGSLGGVLKMRDTTLPGYLAKLDELAASLIARVNAQHAQGSDLTGTPGGDFFVPFNPGSGGSMTGAAHAITVAITDAGKIAAAGLGSGPGSNSNAKMLAAIQDEKFFESGNATAEEFYSHLIHTVGTDMQTADDGLTAQSQVLTQLRNLRDATSGVNMDEEAVNIIRYQKAYEASARLVQVWNTLAEEVINLLGA